MRVALNVSAAVLSLLWIGRPVLAADPGVGSEGVPTSWVDYAAQVSNRLQSELADPANPRASRLHDFLDARVSQDPNVPLTALVRLWFTRDGHIAQLTFDSLGNVAADQDLRAILTAQPIGSEPPHGMREPMVLRIRLAIHS